MPISTLSQDNPQNSFLNFLTSKNIFRTLFRGNPWNVFETDIREMLLEYSGNTTLLLLEFGKRSTFVIINHTFLTQK